MPEVPATVVPFYQRPEVQKDVVVLAGIGVDVLNYFSPHIQPGLASVIGLALRAIINLFSGGKSNPAAMILFLLGFSMLSASAYAANPIGVPVNPPEGGEDDLVVMPFNNINTYTTQGKTNYGLGLAYGIAFANLMPVSVGKVQVSPYSYFAIYTSVEIAPWLNSTGPLSVDYGFMVGLPQLDQSIPEIGITGNWNSLDGQFLQGSPTLGIQLAFPLDILSGSLIRKIQ